MFSYSQFEQYLKLQGILSEAQVVFAIQQPMSAMTPLIKNKHQDDSVILPKFNESYLTTIGVDFS